MSARAWRRRRKPPLLEVVPPVAEFGEPLQYRVIPRVELARARRLEQLARRRARRQPRQEAAPGPEVYAGLTASMETFARQLDLSLAQVQQMRRAFFALRRPIKSTPPL